MSILKSQEMDPFYAEASGTHYYETWSPNHTATTVIKSMIHVMHEPNADSAANVAAAKACREFEAGTSTTFEDKTRAYARWSMQEAMEDGIKIPLTMKEYSDTGSYRMECGETSCLFIN